VLRAAERPVIYLCLGPMTNLGELLRRDRELASRIAVVYYWGTLPGARRHDWNTLRDSTAVREVIEAGAVVYALDIEGPQQLIFDEELYAEIRRIPGPSAELIDRLHDDRRVRQFLRRGHFRAWGETVVLSLLEPDLIEYRPTSLSPATFRVGTWRPELARRAYLAILAAAAPPEDSTSIER
jgi:pyrimidine-specific ribonucleoside hydrolase